jgi:hypothetical protein
MPYIVVGFALYLLYRHFAAKAAAPAVVDLDAQGQPASSQPDQPPVPVPAPAPSPAAAAWTELPEGSTLAPGGTYRASAPPQGMLVMMVIPGRLSAAGFTGVHIYNPGDAFPNDWPDSGSLLRIEATLPASASPQTFDLASVRVWKQSVTQTAGSVLRSAARRAVRVAGTQVVHPKSNGVYDGLVRR